MKLTGSSFEGFVRDEYTTLPESRDRPLFVHLDVHWRNADFAARADGERSATRWRRPLPPSIRPRSRSSSTRWA